MVNLIWQYSEFDLLITRSHAMHDMQATSNRPSANKSGRKLFIPREKNDLSSSVVDVRCVPLESFW